jgi:hypothetical protein
VGDSLLSLDEPSFDAVRSLVRKLPKKTLNTILQGEVTMMRAYTLFLACFMLMTPVYADGEPDHRTPLNTYHADTLALIQICSLEFRITNSLAEGGQPPSEDADYRKCISERGVSARAELKAAILTVKKEKAREALKAYHVAFIAALEGIAPGVDEPKILYQQRQQTLNDKVTEAWAKFDIEE